MKIVSEYTDFYDRLLDGSPKRPVYQRHMRSEIDCFKRYRKAMIIAKIGSGMAYHADILITNFMNRQSRDEYIRVTPCVVGIAGKLYLHVRYENTVLGIDTRCWSYNDISSVYKNDGLRRSFEMVENDATQRYCFSQFDCVNFVMWYNSNQELILCKEPCLATLGVDSWMGAEHAATDITKFLQERKVADAKYLTAPPSKHIQQLGIK
jgi:hypothetical protein